MGQVAGSAVGTQVDPSPTFGTLQLTSRHAPSASPLTIPFTKALSYFRENVKATEASPFGARVTV